MKSLFAFLTGASSATAWASDSLPTQVIAILFALYTGFTWARFDRLEGCGGDCKCGRLPCDCSRKEGRTNG